MALAFCQQTQQVLPVAVLGHRLSEFVQLGVNKAITPGDFFHTPCADAELLIDAIGQVFLVVEAEATTKAEVARARVQLEKLAPEAVGLIVDKLTIETGGSDVRASVVETITGKKFQTFMSKPAISLQLELLRLHWTRFWQRKSSHKKIP